MKLKLIYILLLLISSLPLKLLYFISRITQTINKYILKYRNNIIRNNIKLSFPKFNKKKKYELTHQFYYQFFNTLFEIIKSIKFKEVDFLKRVKIKNIEIIEEKLKQKKPIVLMGSHCGNWEWLLIRIGLINNINLSAVYKPLSNTYFNQILLRLRSRFGAQLIPLKKWKYFLLSKKYDPCTLLFISDQVPAEIKNGIRINFLNQSTLFHKGAEKTVKLLNASVFYIDINTIKPGYYMLEFKKLDAKNITKQYAKHLENTIKRKPENWLWSHNRWKR